MPTMSLAERPGPDVLAASGTACSGTLRAVRTSASLVAQFGAAVSSRGHRGWRGSVDGRRAAPRTGPYPAELARAGRRPGQNVRVSEVSEVVAA